MATGVHPSTGPSTAALVSGIVNDVQELLKEQMTLFKIELLRDVNRAKKAAPSAFLGLGLTLAGTLVLAITLGLLLDWAVPAFPPWVGFLIAGVFLTGLGLVVAYLALRESQQVTVEQSVKGLEENMAWTTNPK